MKSGKYWSSSERLSKAMRAVATEIGSNKARDGLFALTAVPRPVGYNAHIEIVEANL